MLADEAIIELFFARDEAALSETDRKYRRYLLKIAENILSDPQDSEEILNDAYMNAWKAIPPARPVYFSGFLAQAVRRLALNRLKERKAKKRAHSEHDESFDELAQFLSSGRTLEDEYESAELGRLISDFVRQLPQRRRFVFIERFYAAASVEKIAKELSVSIHTVYREIEKIKADLKTYLEKIKLDSVLVSMNHMEVRTDADIAKALEALQKLNPAYDYVELSFFCSQQLNSDVFEIIDYFKFGRAEVVNVSSVGVWVKYEDLDIDALIELLKNKRIGSVHIQIPKVAMPMG